MGNGPPENSSRLDDPRTTAGTAIPTVIILLLQNVQKRNWESWDHFSVEQKQKSKVLKIPFDKLTHPLKLHLHPAGD